MKKKKIIKKCSRFDSCSANVCPIDTEAGLRRQLPGEDRCPFCLKKKAGGQKGTITLVPDAVSKVIPGSNLKMLNRRSQKRWLAINS